MRFLFCLMVLLLTACGQSQRPNSDARFYKVEHQVARWIDDAGDGSFFDDVADIVRAHDRIYLMDRDNCRVVVWDEGFNLLDTWGGPGNGPGESRGILFAAATDEGIWVSSDMSRKMMFFDRDGTVTEELAMGRTRFRTTHTVYGDYLFLTTPYEKRGVLTALGLNGKDPFFFGVPIESRLKGRSSLHNDRHLAVVTLTGKPFLLALAESEPLIELYEVDGSLVKRFSLEKNPLLRPRIDFKMNEVMDENSVVMIFRDLLVEGPDVYCSFYNEHKKVMSFLHFRLEDFDELVFKGVHHVQADEWFTMTSFAHLADGRWLFFDGINDRIGVTALVETPVD